MKTHNKLSAALGLTDYESKVYVTLQRNGPLHIKNISKFSSLPRTAVYPPLNGLINKGLVSESIFGKRKYYSALPSENLRNVIEERRNLVEEAIKELNESRQISSDSAKLETNFYIGKQGIKSAGLIFLNETKEKHWYSFENLGKITDSVGLDFESFYIKERVKRKIYSHMILSVTEESSILNRFLKQDSEQLRKTIILSPNEYLFETTIVVTAGLILMINPNENQFALLIRNTHLANTLLKIHKCIWDRYVK
jgi:sugar-specific transcriptional regulator TrmB